MSDSGLDPVVVDEWRQRNGRIGELGAHRSRQVRTRGREGIELFAELVELEADVPEVFEQICYWRPMTKLFGFCYLQTPVRTRRTPGRIRDFPSDFMIVTSQTIGSTTGTANGHDFRSRPGGLTVTDSRLPYDLTTHGVSDALGLWVPTEVLGEAIAGGATVAPNPPESALTDACTELVTQFARDTIIGGADVDADAEQTVIDIIRLTLGQSTSSEQLVDHPAVIRQAVAVLIDRHFRDPAFTVDTIAAKLHISRRHLYRHFEGSDRASLNDMIADRRLEWARARLLLPENRHLDSIAHAAGFTSTAAFRSRFRSKYGETPDAYRRARPTAMPQAPTVSDFEAQA